MSEVPQDIVFTREGRTQEMPAGVLGHVATCLICGWLVWFQLEKPMREAARKHKCGHRIKKPKD